MDKCSDEVTTLLYAAVGAPNSAGPLRERLTRARAVEDEALAAWSAAVADYDQALDERERIVAQAEVDVRRRMAPLDPARYVRMERSFARALPHHRSAAWVRDMACVQRTRPAVQQVRRRLAVLTDEANAQLATVREQRADATDELIRAFGLGRAVRVTRISAQRLSSMRAGR